ncbi:MAG TPA: SusC/RagA family TonB-linked outer membrane protein [Gemmatimonadaceae bacterium]|jgi:TonB-linked SusC/RagA family outer membrane protein
MSFAGLTRSGPGLRLGARALAARAAAVAIAVALLAVPRSARAQEGVIAGTVITQSGARPLPGVQVAVLDQAGKGAVTDASGRFRITGVTGSQVVVNARMIGYRAITQTVSVGTTNLQFAMSERALELDQVIVTGTAGGEQKRALGASVSKVDVADVVAKQAVPSVDALLNGRAAGVMVLPGTGMVGAGAKVRIRGIGSFSLSADPLIYVDGVRVDNQTSTGISIQAFSSGVISRLNDFDPDQIESIEVLKGPAAATLYGTEAARGVINIITKKGTTGGTTYNFTVTGGQNVFQNAAGRIATNWCHVDTPAGGGTPTCDANGTGPLLGLNTVRRQDSLGAPIFRRGGLRNYDANVSGGTGPFTYFAAGAFTDNQGVDPGNEQRKQSFRTNLSITPNDKVNLQTNFGYVNGHTTITCEAGCGGLMWDSEYSNPANLPQFCDPGDTPCTWVQGFNGAPPAADEVQHDWQDLNRITASATINYNPFSWFTNRLAIGTDVTQEGNVEYVPYLTNDTLANFWGASAQGYRYRLNHQATFNTYDYVGSANLKLRSYLNSKTSFGVQYYTQHNDSLSAEGDYFPAPGLQTLSSAGTPVPSVENFTENNTLGYYGQEEFAYNDRLYLTGAVRVDNNSSFGSQVHWVTYPKVSVSYVASDEPAIQQHLPSWLNSLRLRGAYGGSGQQPLLNTALRTLAPAAGPLGRSILTPSTLGNPDLKPERVLGTEVGFETSMFHDRFGIDFTYFHDDSRDAILSRGVAPGTGFGLNNQYFNAGEIVKHGVEALFKASVMQRRNFAWDMNVNMSTQNAKIIRLNGRDTVIDFGNYAHRVGHSPFDWFSYRVVGATGTYDAATNTVSVPQASIMCDNGHGGATNCYSPTGQLIAPKVYQGHTTPTFEGSWSNTLTIFKNFRLSAMLDAASGYKRLDNNIRIRCQIFDTCLQYVQPQNTDPKLLAQFFSGGPLRNFTINDASYIKFRELSLSYDVPMNIAARAGARNATLTASVRNLGMWTNYTGYDPESQFVAGNPAQVDQAELPQLLTYALTIRLSY